MNMSPLSSRYLLNMDSEDEGVLTVSCAGGARVSFDFPITREKTVGEGLKVTLSGLAGGHSGVEIHKNRTNAILMLLDILRELSLQVSFRISDIHGGSADNAIPSSCQAVIASTGAGTGEGAGSRSVLRSIRSSGSYDYIRRTERSSWICSGAAERRNCDE